jgi:hypothetical protein
LAKSSSAVIPWLSSGSACFGFRERVVLRLGVAALRLAVVPVRLRAVVLVVFALAALLERELVVRLLDEPRLEELRVELLLRVVLFFLSATASASSSVLQPAGASPAHPPIGARGFAPQNTRVPIIPMMCTRTMFSTIDFAVAVPTPTGPPEAV